MNDTPPWFGWNLRSLNVVLLCGGLLTFAILRIGLGLRVLAWRWEIWAAIGAAAIAFSLLAAAGWATVRCVRARRWKTLATLGALALAAAVGIVQLRNSLLPWATIEGRAVDAATGRPLAGLRVQARLTNDSSAGSSGAFAADERLMLAWLLSSGGEALTDGDGRYRFRALPLGKFNIWTAEEGLVAQAIDSLAGKRNATTAAPDLQLGPGEIVKGQVIDIDTGRPVKLLHPNPISDVVMFQGPSRPRSGGAVESAPIRPDGSFELRAALGRSHLYVNGAPDDPRCPKETPVEVKPGGGSEVEIFVRWKDR
jgi:hypothetical protein